MMSPGLTIPHPIWFPKPTDDAEVNVLDRSRKVKGKPVQREEGNNSDDESFLPGRHWLDVLIIVFVHARGCLAHGSLRVGNAGCVVKVCFSLIPSSDDEVAAFGFLHDRICQ